MEIKRIELQQTTIKTFNGLKKFFPVLLGMLLLISIFLKVIPKNYYLYLFKGNFIFDSFLGAFIGSIAAGNPITSYIIGGELIDRGVDLIPVTAFIVAWVTVGTVQLPAEIMMLGKRFAVVRNLTSFILAIIIAGLTAFTFKLL
jgi:uncharacterized membrane protein YraQ (UPF0718 family)